MSFFFKQMPLPIGLDIGSRTMKLIQLKPSGEDNVTVAAAGKYDFPSDLPPSGPERRAELIAGIQSLMQSTKAQGHDIVMGIPDTIVQYKSVRMPKMPDAELHQAVQWEATDRFPADAQPLTVQHICAGEIRQGDEVRQEIGLMAVSNAVLDQYISALTECKLRPAAIETTPVAISRCISLQSRSDGQTAVVRAVVDIGAASTKVVILRGHEVAFYKRLDIGGAKLTNAVAEHLKVPASDAAALRHGRSEPDANAPADSKLFGSSRRENVERAILDCTRPLVQDLAKEIGLCLRYHAVTFRGPRPDGVHLCGGESTDAQVRQALVEQLDLPLSLLEPLKGLDITDPRLLIDRGGNLSEWTIAMGLALRLPFSADKAQRSAA